MLGITGGVAGQLMGLLLGFGLSMLKKTFKEGDQTFDLFNPEKMRENILDLIVIGFALISLIFIFTYMTINNFKMGKGMGVVLLWIYCTFIIISTVIAFKQAFFE